jgi:hypothetical protein
MTPTLMRQYAALCVEKSAEAVDLSQDRKCSTTDCILLLGQAAEWEARAMHWNYLADEKEGRDTPIPEPAP